MPTVALEGRPFSRARYAQVGSLDIPEGGFFGTPFQPAARFVAEAVEDAAIHGGESRLDHFRCTLCGDEVFIHVARRPLARVATVVAYGQYIDGSMEKVAIPRALYRQYHATEPGGIVADCAKHTHRCF